MIAPPVTFSVNGEQYIALVAGWGGAAALIMGSEINPDSTMRNISRVLVFKLGANLELPPPPQRPAPVAPPEDLGSDAQILQAAVRVLRRQGATGFTTTRVAEVAGISVDIRELTVKEVREWLVHASEDANDVVGQLLFDDSEFIEQLIERIAVISSLFLFVGKFLRQLIDTDR